MLSTVTTTHPPASDPGYLMHRHPARVQSFPAPESEPVDPRL